MLCVLSCVIGISLAIIAPTNSDEVTSVLQNVTGVTAMLFYREGEIDSLVALRDAQKIFSEDSSLLDDKKSELWAVPVHFVPIEVTTPRLQWMINSWGIRDVPTLRAWTPRKSTGGSDADATIRRSYEDMIVDVTLAPMLRFLTNVRRRVRGNVLPKVNTMDELNSNIAAGAVSRYQALLLVYGGSKKASQARKFRAVGSAVYTSLIIGQAALRSAELSDAVAQGLYDVIPGLPRNEAFIVFASAETLQSRTPRLLPVEGWEQESDESSSAGLVASAVTSQLDSPLAATSWERFKRQILRKQNRVNGVLELTTSEDWLGFLEASVEKAVGLLVSSSQKNSDDAVLVAALRRDTRCRMVDVAFEQPTLHTALRLRGKRNPAPLIASVVLGSRLVIYNASAVDAAHATEVCKFFSVVPPAKGTLVFPRFPAPLFNTTKT